MIFSLQVIRIIVKDILYQELHLSIRLKWLHGSLPKQDYCFGDKLIMESNPYKNTSFSLQLHN